MKDADTKKLKIGDIVEDRYLKRQAIVIGYTRINKSKGILFETIHIRWKKDGLVEQRAIANFRRFLKVNPTNANEVTNLV